MDNIIINIDSRFRNKQHFSNSGKFTYGLNETLKNCKYIRLSSIEFPNLYFTFTEKKLNTSFILYCNGKTYTVTIPDGFYASDTLLLEIQTQLDKANIYMGSTFSINFNYNNGFVSIINGVNFTINFANGKSNYPSLGYQLGFRGESYMATSGVNEGTAGFSVISESQLDTIGDSYLFLKINDYGVIYHDFEDIVIRDTSNQIISREKYGGYKNIFAKIIINTNKAEHVFDNGSNFLTKSFIFRQPIDLDKFNIELTDPKGNIVEMVHMDFSMTLEVGVIYDLSLSYDMTDSLANKFMLTGLPSLPVLDTVRKKSHNLNILNDTANQSGDLTNYKISSKATHITDDLNSNYSNEQGKFNISQLEELSKLFDNEGNILNSSIIASDTYENSTNKHMLLSDAEHWSMNNKKNEKKDENKKRKEKKKYTFKY